MKKNSNLVNDWDMEKGKYVENNKERAEGRSLGGGLRGKVVGEAKTKDMEKNLVKNWGMQKR